MTVDYYGLLGVTRTASDEEIRRAYRRLARQAHPDTGGTSTMFQLLEEAQRVLLDPHARREYDASRAGPQQPRQERRPPRTEAQTGHRREPGPVFIDRERLSWWAAVDPTAPVRYEPDPAAQTTRVRKFLGWTAVACLPGALMWLVSNPWLAAPFLALTGALLYSRLHGRRLPARLDKAARVVVAAAAFLLAVGAVYILAGHGSVSSLLIVVLSAPWLVAVVVGPKRLGAILSARKAAVQLAEQLPVATLATAQVWGRPGQRLEDARHSFGDDTVELGQIGERLTATVLEVLCRMPAAKIVHGLRWPGRLRADIGHVVLVGHRLAVIDTKVWNPGRYAMDTYQQVCRDGRPFRGGVLTLPDAVAAMAELLPQVEVRGYIAVHPAHTDGPLLIDIPPTPQMTVTCAGDLAELVGSWLAGGDPYLLDRYHLLTLLEQSA